MPTISSMIMALDRYAVVARELDSLYGERAKLQNAILEDWQSAYNTAIADGTTTYNAAQATAKQATMRWTIELNKVQGEVDGHLVELRYLDIYLEVMRHANPN